MCQMNGLFKTIFWVKTIISMRWSYSVSAFVQIPYQLNSYLEGGWGGIMLCLHLHFCSNPKPTQFLIMRGTMVGVILCHHLRLLLWFCSNPIAARFLFMGVGRSQSGDDPINVPPLFVLQTRKNLQRATAEVWCINTADIESAVLKMSNIRKSSYVNFLVTYFYVIM